MLYRLSMLTTSIASIRTAISTLNNEFNFKKFVDFFLSVMETWTIATMTFYSRTFDFSDNLVALRMFFIWVASSINETCHWYHQILRRVKSFTCFEYRDENVFQYKRPARYFLLLLLDCYTDGYLVEYSRRLLQIELIQCGHITEKWQAFSMPFFPMSNAKSDNPIKHNQHQCFMVFFGTFCFIRGKSHDRMQLIFYSSSYCEHRKINWKLKYCHYSFVNVCAMIAWCNVLCWVACDNIDNNDLMRNCLCIGLIKYEWQCETRLITSVG